MHGPIDGQKQAISASPGLSAGGNQTSARSEADVGISVGEKAPALRPNART